jgi:D-alanyl-D-alanine endopeptidase (penicillin-binding protein 7)
VRLSCAVSVIALSLLLASLGCSEVPAPPPAPTPVVRGWSPPAWLDHPDAEVIASLGGPARSERGPRVRAQAAIVADLDRGEVLWARRADEVRPLASLTKLAAALTLVALEPEPALDREWCVTPEVWPPGKAAVSKFETGVCHPGWDYLGAALVQSDARGAMGLPWLAGVPYAQFVDAMGEVVAELGGRARFTEPSGIDEDNVGSARDALRVVVAASMVPLLSEVSSSAVWKIERDRGRTMLVTTNRLHERWETLAAKTGFTAPAGYCLAVVVRTRTGARIAAVVLNAPTAGARFDDVAAMVSWAEGWTEPSPR